MKGETSCSEVTIGIRIWSLTFLEDLSRADRAANCRWVEKRTQQTKYCSNLHRKKGLVKKSTSTLFETNGSRGKNDLTPRIPMRGFGVDISVINSRSLQGSYSNERVIKIALPLTKTEQDFQFRQLPNMSTDTSKTSQYHQLERIGLG